MVSFFMQREVFASRDEAPAFPVIRIDVYASDASTTNSWFSSKAPAMKGMIACKQPTQSSIQN